MLTEYSWQRYFNTEVFEKLSLLIIMIGYGVGEICLSFYAYFYVWQGLRVIK